MGDTFAELARNGPLLLAVGGAALAGLVSFLSPCVLPLVPGYLSYVTGLAGVGLERASAAPAPDRQLSHGRPDAGPDGRLSDSRPDAGPDGHGRPAAGATTTATAARPTPTRRVLAGTLLFIAGFTVVFTLTAILFASIGKALFTYQRPLEIVIGALIVVLGLAFVGLIPGFQRELRIRKLPNAGLLGAPVFGAVFALSWTPCVGPTLGAVLGMATASGQTDRAVVLAVAYCLGLGVPFVLFGLFFERSMGLFKAIRRNSRWVTRIGGALLIVVGLALITGGWNQFLIWLQTTVGVGEVGI